MPSSGQFLLALLFWHLDIMLQYYTLSQFLLFQVTVFTIPTFITSIVISLHGELQLQIHTFGGPSDRLAVTLGFCL
jgi:hypothetical protein